MATNKFKFFSSLIFIWILLAQSVFATPPISPGNFRVSELDGNLIIEVMHVPYDVFVELKTSEFGQSLRSFPIPNTEKHISIPFNKSAYKYITFLSQDQSTGVKLSLDKNNVLVSNTPIIEEAIYKDNKAKIKINNYQQLESALINFHNNGDLVKNHIVEGGGFGNGSLEIGIASDYTDVEILAKYKTGGRVSSWAKQTPKQSDVSNETIAPELSTPEPPTQAPETPLPTIMYDEKIIKARKLGGKTIVYDCYENPFLQVEASYISSAGKTLKTSILYISNNQFTAEIIPGAIAINLKFMSDEYKLDVKDNLIDNRIIQPKGSKDEEEFFYESTYPVNNIIRKYNERIPIHSNSQTYTDIYLNGEILHTKLDSISVNEVTIPFRKEKNSVRFFGYDDFGNKKEMTFQIMIENPYDLPPVDVLVTDDVIVEDNPIKILFDKDYNVGKTYQYNQIVVRGRLDGAKDLTVNGTDIKLDKNGNFSISLELKEGKNNFKFKAKEGEYVMEENWTLKYKRVPNAIDVSTLRREEVKLKDIPPDYEEQVDLSQYEIEYFKEENATHLDGGDLDLPKGNPLFLYISFGAIGIFICLTFLYNPNKKNKQ